MNLAKIKQHRLVITIIIALVFGFLSTLMFNSMLADGLDLKQVPITNKHIKEGQAITKEDITFVEMPNTIIDENIYLKEEEFVGKVVDYGYGLAQGSLLYKEGIKETSAIKNAGYFELEKQEIAVTLEVDQSLTYANAIREGHLIDLYFSGTGVEHEGEEKIIYGELVKQAKVLAIYNNSLEESGYNDADEVYLVVALTYENADLVGRAKEFGEVFPIISYDSLHQEEDTVNYYDVGKLRDAIYQRTIDITLKELSEELEVYDE